ncbi:MAG: hypothetical protein P4N59_31215 [Negativicutes bacterium]|nr:hypothetical protein [Negativicutes bacterium]
MKKDDALFTPETGKSVNDAASTEDSLPVCDDATMAPADTPPQTLTGRLCKSVKGLAKDFVDYSKKAEL